MSFGFIASSYKVADDSYAAQVLADTPLLYWRLGETSGSVAVDSSGNGRDGAYVGSPDIGKVGLIRGDTDLSGYFEESTGDHVSLASSAWMNVTDMTISCAVVFAANGLRMFASRYHDPDNDRSWFLYSQAREFKFYVRGSDGNETIVSSGFSAIPGEVYYLAAYSSAAGAGIRIYDSTGLVGSATGVGRSVNPSTRPFMVGRCDGVSSYQHESYIDEVAYYGSVLTPSRLDALATNFFSLRPWIHRSSGVEPRNGTLDHTVTFTPAAAGSLLVAVLSGAMTHTAVSAGWTEQLQAVDSSELSIFTKTATAGESSFDVTHNNPNRPLVFTVYEFKSGSYYHSGAGHNTGAWQTLNSLPGTPDITIFYAYSETKADAGNPTQYAEWYFPAVEDLDVMEPNNGVTDGVFTTIAYQDNYIYTSAGAPIVSVYQSVIDSQVATFAISVAQ